MAVTPKNWDPSLGTSTLSVDGKELMITGGSLTGLTVMVTVTELEAGGSPTSVTVKVAGYVPDWP